MVVIEDENVCPNCGSDKYVVSIFGSVCPVCFYEPVKENKTNEE